jgi:hypothetical protein
MKYYDDASTVDQNVYHLKYNTVYKQRIISLQHEGTGTCNHLVGWFRAPLHSAILLRSFSLLLSLGVFLLFVVFSCVR